jgi:hypothetical protein
MPIYTNIDDSRKYTNVHSQKHTHTPSNTHTKTNWNDQQKKKLFSWTLNKS